MVLPSGVLIVVVTEWGNGERRLRTLGERDLIAAN
jgi:hypothetical protein